MNNIKHIEHIVIKVTTPFNGTTSNTIIVGDEDDDDRFVNATTNIDLTVADETHIFKHHKYASATQMNAKVVTDGNAGEVEIVVFYGHSSN